MKNFLQNKTVKIILALVCIVAFFYLGEKRLAVFIHTSYPANPSPEMVIHSQKSPSHSNFSESISCPICQRKWLLTFGFCFAYMLLSTLTIWAIFQNTKTVKLVLIVYCTLFVSCILLLAVGFLFHNFGTAYRVTNRIIAIIQSPLVVMILFAYLKLQDVFSRKKF